MICIEHLFLAMTCLKGGQCKLRADAGWRIGKDSVIHDLARTPHPLLLLHLLTSLKICNLSNLSRFPG